MKSFLILILTSLMLTSVQALAQKGSFHAYVTPSIGLWAGAEGPLLNSFSINGGVELRKNLPKSFKLGVGLGYYKIKAYKTYNIGHGGPETSQVMEDVYVEIPVLVYKQLFQFREGKSHLHLLGGAVFVLSPDEKAQRLGDLIKDNPLVPTLGLSYMHEFKENYYWNADFRFPYFTFGLGVKF